MEINSIYKKIIDLQDQKSKIESEIKEYKKRLDSLIEAERDPEIKIVYIPEFITDVIEYLEERFPTYSFVSMNEDSRMATIKELDNFVPKKKEFEDGGMAYRRISKGRATIDLDELQKRYPDIFSDIVMMVPEIDENKVNEMLQDDPSFLEIIEDVLRVENPSVAIVVSKSKKVKE